MSWVRESNLYAAPAQPVHGFGTVESHLLPHDGTMVWATSSSLGKSSCKCGVRWRPRCAVSFYKRGSHSIELGLEWLKSARSLQLQEGYMCRVQWWNHRRLLGFESRFRKVELLWRMFLVGKERLWKQLRTPPLNLHDHLPTLTYNKSCVWKSGNSNKSSTTVSVPVVRMKVQSHPSLSVRTWLGIREG